MSDQKPQYEIRDIQVKPIIIFSIGLILLTLMALGGMYFLLSSMEKHANKTDRVSSYQLRREIFTPSPALEVHPSKLLHELRDYENKKLNGYGWTDKQNKIARIPIEPAMRQLLQQNTTPQEPRHDG